YFVQVFAYNVKGWGPAQISSPPSAVPSSWKECCSVIRRRREQERAVTKLLEQVEEPQYRGFFIDNILVTAEEQIPLVEIDSCSTSVTQELNWFVKSALGTADLGQVYYEPLRDQQGNMLLLTLHPYPIPQPPAPLHWTSLASFQRSQRKSSMATGLLQELTAIDTLAAQLKLNTEALPYRLEKEKEDWLPLDESFIPSLGRNECIIPGRGLSAALV
ncbi:UNVERIFIED_CONTAM: hypothetical protein FKN15_072694, partial [Acipenser sinensis]